MSRRLAASVAAILLAAAPALAQQVPAPSPSSEAPAGTKATGSADKTGCPWSQQRTS